MTDGGVSASDVSSTDSTISPQANSGQVGSGSTTPSEMTAAPVVSEISEVVAEIVPEVVAEPATQAVAETVPMQTPAPGVETVVVPGPVVPAPARSTDSGQAAPEPAIKSFLSRALEALQIGKRAKLDKILAEAKKKHSITNDGVEKLLRVSDSTAQRYLMQLVREGKLKRLKEYSQTVYEPM